MPSSGRLPFGGWSWFCIRCLRAFGSPPALLWLGLVRPPVFTCLRSTYCRALTRQRAPSDFFARAKKSPRNTPDCRDPGPLCGPGFPSLRGFSRAALNSLRLRLRSDIQRLVSCENPLHSARRQRGVKVKTTAVHRFVVMDQGWVFRHLGTLGLGPLRAAPAARAPEAFGWQYLLLCRGAGIPSVLTFLSRMEPLVEGVMGREKALDV